MKKLIIITILLTNINIYLSAQHTFKSKKCYATHAECMAENGGVFARCRPANYSECPTSFGSFVVEE